MLLDASIKIRKMEKEDILSVTQTRGGKKEIHPHISKYRIC